MLKKGNTVVLRYRSFYNKLLIAFLLIISFSTIQKVNSQPGVIQAGMTPEQYDWKYSVPLDNVNKQVKFFMKVQRQGYLNSYGTFDYNFRIQVIRPDGTEVWKTTYGYDENGYSEQIFTLPVLFWERSADRANPSFGIWKIRLVLEEKNTGKEVSVKEFALNFNDGKSQDKTGQTTPKTEGCSGIFPVQPFTFRLWNLKAWGAGIFDEVTIGSDTYDKDIKIIKCTNTISVKEISEAWMNGHKFGVWVTGPPVSTYRNSNNNPLYLFGFILHRPNGEADGANPGNRQNNYSNNPGTVLFPFDLRDPGKYRLDVLIRDRDANYWEASAWNMVGSIEFTVTP